MTTRRLDIVPMTLAEANAFVLRHHRHRGPVVGCKFALGVADREGGHIVGVALVGRPVARGLDDGWTLEVNRSCTDGTRNANSCLYAAAWRATRALGYRRLITYTLSEESGTSLRAAGWKIVGETTRIPRWQDRVGRPRVETHPRQDKFRWEIAG